MSRSLARDVVARAEQLPDAPALLCDAPDGLVVTYAELVERAHHIGAELAETYPDNGRPLALRAPKSATAVATVLACMLAGRPLLLASTELGHELLSDLVRRSGCRSVVGIADGGLTHEPVPAPGEPPVPLPADTSLLLTTSGSTGVPKLVPLSGDAVDAFTSWAGSAFPLGPGNRVLNYAPLNFDLCLLDIWATLRSGGCVVPVDQARSADPRYLADLLGDTRPQVVQAVPMFYRLLAESDARAGFPSVRDVVLTGDHVPRSVRSELPGLFPGARLHNVYGCTETNDSMLHTFTAAEADKLDVLPLGRPLPGVTVEVLVDDRRLEGPGTGELLVSTPFQTSGYLGGGGTQRFLTRAGRTWYRTGDVVARTADGELALVGRTDSQVKVRGVRINLEEVERALLSHDGVAEAAVVAVPDQDSGAVLHAFVRRTDDRMTGLQLRTHCAARITRAAIPRRFHLVSDPLPVGPTGKVSRRRLLEELG